MKKILLLITFLFTQVFFAQDAQQEIGDLKKIYSNLEYNTIAFDDLKQKWIISDPVFVREVFNKFVSKNALRLRGRALNQLTLIEKAKEVQDGNILIDLRKRYYDDEIEYFAFIPFSEIDNFEPKLLVDSVDDGFFLKDIVGSVVYGKLQEQSYFFSNLTKEIFDTKAGYYFDVNVDAVDPSVMFWSTTSDYRNKFLLSLFGKWGQDYIFMPGWYFPEMIVGGRITYFDVLSGDPDDYTYEVSFGTGMASHYPYVSIGNEQKLDKAGQSVYAKISGQALKYVMDDAEDYYIDLEVFTTPVDFEYSDLKFASTRSFFSIRNYAVFKVRKERLFNLFNFGMAKAALGISTYSVDEYKYDTKLKTFSDLRTTTDFMNKFEHFFFGEFGVEKGGGLVQYDITAVLGFNFVEGYLMGGIKSQIMLSDTFGLQFRIYQGLGMEPSTYGYRTTPTVVFSPVLRINY
ncbi:MAG: hypothetical protein KKD86_05275 [Bacteroidetes bacterium]|nr:hypothetical protein [Bacteroidota bacterium]